MTGFKLDRETGDLMLTGEDICLCTGEELLCQTVACVVGTNQGEWFLNEKEGMDFLAIFGKRPNPDRIRDEVSAALHQIDETFILESFTQELENRKLTIGFTASSEAGRVTGKHTF